MNILIATIGTRGDVQPYIALSLGLQKAGFQVVLASHPAMKGLIESYGVQFAPIGADIDLGRETAIIRGRSRNVMMGFLRVMRFSFNILEAAHDDLLALCKKADWIIISHTAAGSIEADQLGKPTLSVTLFPQAVPVIDPQQSWIMRILLKAAGAGMDLVMTAPLNRIRKKFGISPMGPYGITSARLNLIPVSPSVYPANPLWDPRHRQTGYWFSPDPSGWAPPGSLLNYLERGDPPILISLGTMSLGGADSEETARVVVEGLRLAGLRAILQGWEEILPNLDLPDEIFPAGSLPHSWVLPRCTGIVHHGGFGTSAAGFQAGIPSLAIPHIIDQYIWGQKIFELGVGPKPIPRKDLTPARLATALQAMKTNLSMQQKAANLGSAIQREPGVENAVEAILEVV